MTSQPHPNDRTRGPERSDRAQAFEQLNVEAYRAIVEHAADIISLVDADSRFVFYSRAFERILGYAGAEVIGAKVADFLHPDDRDAVIERLSDVIAGVTPQNRAVYRFRHADGTWRWLDSYGDNQLSNPNLSAIVIISREMTALQRVEHQLRQVEEVGKLGHWRWAVGEDRPFWSDGMYKLGGFDRAEWDPTEDWTRVVHPDDIAMMIAAHSMAVRDGRPFAYRARLKHRDGGYRVIATQGQAETDANGRVSTLLCVCQDMTDRVAAQDAVALSEQQYRLLAANASDVIARFTLTDGMLFISPAVSNLLGYAPDEMTGFGFIDAFFSAADYQHFWQRMQLAAAREGPVTVTSRMRHNQGHLIWMESSAHAVPLPETDQFELVIVGRDVTERKRHELEILTARDAAEMANRTKSLFLANMSHELRTPLNAIIGFSEVLKEQMFGALGVPRYVEYARDIHDSGLHLLELINDILDMSKIEAGKYTLHLENVDLDDVVDTSIRVVRLRAQEMGVVIDRMVGPQPVVVRVDRRAVKQILLNLVSNAIKFTPDGGRVVISVECVEQRVLLRVADTGIGIPEEDLPRLARPFEQSVTAEHHEKRSGTGLGLALVKALTELHGGALRIDSKIGKGTVVTVELPFEPATTRQAPLASA